MKREHTFKVSKPKKLAEGQFRAVKGPPGVGVPATEVPMPKRVGSKVKPPFGGKGRGHSRG